MTARTPIAYVAIAAFCILLHNGVMILADSVGVALWLAVLLSFGIVASTGYVLHGIFTFRQQLRLSALGRYALAMSANVPLTFVTTWFWHNGVGLAMVIASPLASACMLGLNFFLGRWAIAAPNPRLAGTG